MQYGAIVPINILRPCPIDNSTRDWHPIEFNSMTTRFRWVDHRPDWFLLSIWCSCNIGASTKYMSMVKWMRPQERSMCIKCEMVSVCVCVRVCPSNMNESATGHEWSLLRVSCRWQKAPSYRMVASCPFSGGSSTSSSSTTWDEMATIIDHHSTYHRAQV